MEMGAGQGLENRNEIEPSNIISSREGTCLCELSVYGEQARIIDPVLRLSSFGE